MLMCSHGACHSRVPPRKLLLEQWPPGTMTVYIGGCRSHLICCLSLPRPGLAHPGCARSRRITASSAMMQRERADALRAEVLNSWERDSNAVVTVPGRRRAAPPLHVLLRGGLPRGRTRRVPRGSRWRRPAPLSLTLSQLS